MKSRVLLGAGVALLVAQTALAQTAGQPIPRPGDGVSAPMLTHEVKPNYPPATMAAGVEGVVVLECVVTPDGTVGEVRVTQPLEPSLDQAAIDALKQWRFRPGRKDGKAVAVMVEVEMSFTLRGQGPRLDSPEVYKPGPGVTLPKLVKDMKATYSAAAIRERIEGVVEIECVVRADGTVGHMRVKKALHPELDASALKAVSQYRFAPGMKDAGAVPVQIVVEVSFYLQ